MQSVLELEVTMEPALLRKMEKLLFLQKKWYINVWFALVQSRGSQTFLT
jgi:hypothetical protein